MDIPRKCAALSLLIASACHTAESPPPSTEQACTRLGEREARSFTGLQPMGTIGTSKLYGRPKEMLCSDPGQAAAANARSSELPKYASSSLRAPQGSAQAAASR